MHKHISARLLASHFIRHDCSLRLPDWSFCWAYQLVLWPYIPQVPCLKVTRRSWRLCVCRQEHCFEWTATPPKWTVLVSHEYHATHPCMYWICSAYYAGSDYGIEQQLTMLIIFFWLPNWMHVLLSKLCNKQPDVYAIVDITESLNSKYRTHWSQRQGCSIITSQQALKQCYSYSESSFMDSPLYWCFSTSTPVLRQNGWNVRWPPHHKPLKSTGP